MEEEKFTRDGKLKELRNTMTTFDVYTYAYTIQPNRISTTPEKTIECRFGEKCKKSIANCKFYHPAAKDRRLKASITVRKREVEHFEKLIPGIWFEPSNRIETLWSATVWMPYTATLAAIVGEHKSYIDQRLKELGEWKTVPCINQFPHDEESCRYAHLEGN